MKLEWIALGVLLLGLGVLALQSSADPPASQAMAPTADDGSGARPLKLLMVGLAQDMDRISRGLWHGDTVLITQGAEAIASHPKILPAEIRRIQEALGDQFEAFVGIDQRVHELASGLSQITPGDGMETALNQYQQLQASCIACHTSFRERVRAALK